MKEGDRVYVFAIATPGHERPGYYGTIVDFTLDGRMVLVKPANGGPIRNEWISQVRAETH